MHQKSELPEGWTWIVLENVYDVRDGTHNTPKYTDKGVPLITSKNLSSGRLDFDDIKYISEKDHNEISKRSNVEQNDILFAMIGTIGNPVIVKTKVKFSIKNVALFKYYSLDLSEPKYLCYFLESVSDSMKKGSGGGVQPFISLTKLRNYPVPLPPLPEQHHIVSAIEALFARLDATNEKLDRVLEILKAFRQAVIKLSLQGKLVEQNPADEPALS